MSRVNSQKLNDPRSRVLYAIENEFDSDADFCREAHLSRSWVNYFRKAENPSINDQVLLALFDHKNINPLWLLKDQGPYKIFESNDDTMLVSEDPAFYGTFSKALELIERIERTEAEVKDVPLPEGLEIQLLELALKLLKRRQSS